MAKPGQPVRDPRRGLAWRCRLLHTIGRALDVVGGGDRRILDQRLDVRGARVEEIVRKRPRVVWVWRPAVYQQVLLLEACSRLRRDAVAPPHAYAGCRLDGDEVHRTNGEQKS